MRFFDGWRVGTPLAALLASSFSFATEVAPSFTTPSQIAVLLPQSGRMAKAAETIRDGLLAAYYQDSSASSDSPTLRFYNSDAGDILTLVTQAEQDGAGIIIGPLDREHVQQLLELGPVTSIPLLTLNSANGQAANIIQFALSPEDEIQRLVAWMERNTIRQPLILTSAEDVGQRQQKLFQAAWQIRHSAALTVVTLDAARKGGIVAGVRDAIRQRASHDAIFLASPSLARLVRPALTYYHSPLPLYSLASAWDPRADATGQGDLDGLRFCDQPWMLEEPQPAQTRLYETFARPPGSYDRLYAFGADAWTLVNKWQALQDGEAVALHSGLVQADSSGHLRRIPTCAEVRNGTATPLWSPENRHSRTSR